MKIAGRAVSTLISTQGIGDLYQLYVLGQRDRIDYNVTVSPTASPRSCASRSTRPT